MRRLFSGVSRALYVALFFVAWFAPAQARAASYTVSEESDWYFTVPEESLATIYGNSNAGCAEFSTDPYLWLYEDGPESTGALIAQDDDGNHNSQDQCVSAKIQTTLSAGDYRLRAGYCCSIRGLGANPHNGATYELVLDFTAWQDTTTTTGATTSTSTTSTSTTTEPSTSTTSTTAVPTSTSSTTTSTTTSVLESSTTLPPTTTSPTTTSTLLPTTTTTTTSPPSSATIAPVIPAAPRPATVSPPPTPAPETTSTLPATTTSLATTTTWLTTTTQATTSSTSTPSTTLPSSTTSTLGLPSTTEMAPTTVLSSSTSPSTPATSAPTANTKNTTESAQSSVPPGPNSSTTSTTSSAQVSTSELPPAPEPDAPVAERLEFEREVNVFGGEYDDYVPVGSNVTVAERRTIVAITATVASPLSPLPAGRRRR